MPSCPTGSPVAHRDRPGSRDRGQPDARRDRVRAQLGHIVAGRLDVHGAHLRPGRPQQPDRCLQQATGHLGVRGGPAQQLFVAENPQPQRHRPAARVVGQHDELLVQPPVGHVTPVRGPCRPDAMARKNDADSRHGGPPADGGAAIRLTLVSVRWPATGYPPAAGPGQELLITTAPLLGRLGGRPGWRRGGRVLRLATAGLRVRDQRISGFVVRLRGRLDALPMVPGGWPTCSEGLA